LEGNEPLLIITFDQETALEHREIPFITPIHPLTAMAVAYWSNQNAPVFTQVGITDAEIPEGVYLFAYYLWETVSLRFDVRLVPLAWDLQNDRLDETLAATLSRLIMNASAIERLPAPLLTEIEQMLHKVEEVIHERRFAEVTRLVEANRQLADQQVASLQRYYQRRLQRVDGELLAVSDERIRRMKESERNRIQQEWERRQREIEDNKDADIISQRVAYGILEVNHNAQ
jgi:hypothetical protein